MWSPELGVAAVRVIAAVRKCVVLAWREIAGRHKACPYRVGVAIRLRSQGLQGVASRLGLATWFGVATPL